MCTRMFPPLERKKLHALEKLDQENNQCEDILPSKINKRRETM